MVVFIDKNISFTDILGRYFWHKILVEQKLIKTHKNIGKPKKMIEKNNNTCIKVVLINKLYIKIYHKFVTLDIYTQ